MVRVKADDEEHADWMIIDEQHYLTVPVARAAAWKKLQREGQTERAEV